jgi:uncharacterized phage infection (PIP) family protein YhgE
MEILVVAIVLAVIVVVGGLCRLEGVIVATFDEVRADYKAYAQSLKDRADAAEAALVAANERAQVAADALQAFQDDDAATDAQQLADAAQANADALAQDLADLQATPVPDAPADEEPPVEVPDDVSDETV